MGFQDEDVTAFCGEGVKKDELFGNYSASASRMKGVRVAKKGKHSSIWNVAEQVEKRMPRTRPARHGILAICCGNGWACARPRRWTRISKYWSSERSRMWTVSYFRIVSQRQRGAIWTFCV